MCIILEQLDTDIETIDFDFFPVCEGDNETDLTANYSICIDDIE